MFSRRWKLIPALPEAGVAPWRLPDMCQKTGAKIASPDPHPASCCLSFQPGITSIFDCLYHLVTGGWVPSLIA